VAHEREVPQYGVTPLEEVECGDSQNESQEEDPEHGESDVREGMPGEAR
jgi:hypothetical protein